MYMIWKISFLPRIDQVHADHDPEEGKRKRVQSVIKILIAFVWFLYCS